MLLLFPIWACLAAICLATGALCWRGMVWALPRWFLVRPRVEQLFWLGFCALLAELQLYSLVHRIDRHAWMAVLVVGAAGIAPALALARSARRRPALGVVAARVAVGAFFAFSVGWSASQPSRWHDTLSTHIQQVKWAEAFRALPGLGNLNPKLGFDQAHHLLAALVDFGPYQHRYPHVVDGFLLFAALLHWVLVLTRPARTRHAVRAKIFAALTLPFLAAKATTVEVASLSGDLAMGVVAVACTLELAGTPPMIGARRRVAALAIAVAAALGGALFAIKFSGMMLTLGAFAAAAWHLRLRVRERPGWRAAVAVAIPSLLVFATLARRLILTGWPLFPIPHGALPFAWTVPYDRTLDQYIWIKSWARLPGVNAREVLDGGFWRWFVPWYDAFRRGHEHALLACGCAALAARLALRDRVGNFATRILEGAAVLAIAYWFLGAPDLRFGGVFLWILLGAMGSALLTDGYATSSAGRALVFCLCVGFTSSYGGFDVLPDREPSWTELPVAPVPEMQIVTFDGDKPGAFSVRTPLSGSDICGDVALPCTHYLGIQRLRVPPTVDHGFLPR